MYGDDYMDIFGVVIRRSIIVLVIWLILVMVLAPALVKMDEVTEYRAERLLPSGAESIKATRIVLNISGRGITTAYTIVLVKTVNISDIRLLDIDNKIRDSLKSFIVYYSSPYYVAREIYNDIDQKIYRYSIESYNQFSNVYDVLEVLSSNREYMLNQLNMSYNYISMLKQYYEYVYNNRDIFHKLAKEIYNNLTTLYNIYVESNNTKDSITYEDFRRMVLSLLIHYFVEYIGTTFSEIKLPTNKLDIVYAMNIIIDHLANIIWCNKLSEEYVYRFIVGAPVAITIISLTHDVAHIDYILLNMPMINALIDGVYNSSVIIDTIEFLAPLMGINIMSMKFNGIEIPAKEIIKEIINLPQNITQIDLIKPLANVLVKKLQIGLELNAEIIHKALVSILVEGIDPLDILAELGVRYLSLEIDINIFKKYLELSLKEKDPMILYNNIKYYLQSHILSNVLKSMEGIMVSSNYTAFLIIIDPIGNSTQERIANANRATNTIKEILSKHGYRYNISVIGDDILGLEIVRSMSRDIERVNIISMIVTISIALILIGGLSATALPFLGIAASIIVTHGVLYLLAIARIISLTSWGRMLVITTAFGLGMNYSSYIILRFKEIYLETRDCGKAAYESVKYALPAILASASTDIIGFAVMKLAWELPLLSSIGDSVPIAISIVLAVSLTLTPALLTIAGNRRWFWWPHRLEAGGRRWRGYSVSRIKTLILIILSLLILGYSLMGFTKFSGSHDYSLFMPENSQVYQAYVELQKMFPVGKLMPVYVVYILDKGYSIYDEQVLESVGSLYNMFMKLEGISEVYSFVNPGYRSKEIYIGRDNKTFYLEIILRPPPLSREGIDLTKEIIRIAKENKPKQYNKVLVGGFSASSVEIEELLSNVFWSRVFPIAFILMCIAMSISFMSLLSGFIALSSIAIGYITGVAVASAIANFYAQPTLWFLPFLTLPAVLGVGLDFNSYFMNRQRYEIANGKDKYKATSTAITVVSHLVLGLGLIVTATYASLIIGSSWGIKELGIALSTAVFITTIMAAFILTPAILAILGEKAWWPGSRRWRKGD